MSERHEDNTETTKTSPFCEKSSEIWIYNQLTTADSSASVMQLQRRFTSVPGNWQHVISEQRFSSTESLSSYKMRACEAVNTVKAWLWLSVILLLCISHRSTFTVWLIVLLWNWKLKAVWLCVMHIHVCLIFEPVIWLSCSKTASLHCDGLWMCAHSNRKGLSMINLNEPSSCVSGIYSPSRHTILVKFGFLFLTEMIWKSQTYKDFSFAHFILWS